jgi:3-dehydroquinate dehydratase-1
MRSSAAERVCVSLLARTTDELQGLVETAARAGARLVELRLDGLGPTRIEEGLEVSRRLGLRHVVTIRPRWEGGLYDGDEERRISLLKKAALSADFVDLEYVTAVENGGLVEVLRESGCRLILSRHYTDGGPPAAELRAEAERIFKLSDIVKIVTRPSRMGDALAHLSLYSEPWARGRLICFSMGEAWRFTRILCVALGAPFTYASLPGQAVAPGQPTFEEAVEAVGEVLGSWRFSPC